MTGQITLEEYLQSRHKTFPTCGDCVCNNCLYWWSSRCPYGKCYDDHRAEANEFVRQYHRHHRPVTGHKFSIAAASGGEIVGVAIVERPVS